MLANHRKYLQLHPYRRHRSTPRAIGAICADGDNVPEDEARPASLRCRRDGIAPAIVGTCRAFESSLSGRADLP
jgi:hypothetical protein